MNDLVSLKSEALRPQGIAHAMPPDVSVVFLSLSLKLSWKVFMAEFNGR